MYGIRLFGKPLIFSMPSVAGQQSRAYMVFVIATGPVCITNSGLRSTEAGMMQGILPRGSGIPGRSFTAFLAWLSGYMPGERKVNYMTGWSKRDAGGLIGY